GARRRQAQRAARGLCRRRHVADWKFRKGEGCGPSCNTRELRTVTGTLGVDSEWREKSRASEKACAQREKRQPKWMHYDALHAWRNGPTCSELAKGYRGARRAQ